MNISTWCDSPLTYIHLIYNKYFVKFDNKMKLIL